MSKFENIARLSDWFDGITEPLIIAGPCSAETEEQVLSTAHQISKIDRVKVFRAGIWKPRTRPGSFEGVGEIGLKWLQRVKNEYGLMTTCEVANPEHIDLALKYGIDILWIGARTTSNPFSVQVLADKLKGVDIPVLVKNPVNPDLDLWIGSLERFNQIGIKRLAAIHRGFYPFEATQLRNIPKWEIPIELKTRFPELPIFCDPSHIAGARAYVPDIAQRALDLNMDGLMIESHINPKIAKSDVLQQVKPQVLNDILNTLVFRKTLTDDKEFVSTLLTMREQIDSVDNQMLELLAKRMSIVEEIGKYKKKNQVAIFQLRRWQDIINTRVKLGNKLGLSGEFIKRLLQLVHKESIQKQTEVMKKNGQGD